MIKHVKFLGILVFVTSIFIFSCKKQNHEDGLGQLQVNFSLSSLKSTIVDTSSETTLSEVIVTIEDLDGKVVKSDEHIELYNMNGNYISKPLALPEGKYKLTGFLVLDWKNNVVYASPVKGSTKANLVKNPLPLSFDISKDNVTKVEPEVINAASCKPEDFGYSTFTLNIADNFDFMMGVFIYDDSIKNFKLTSSVISILSDTVGVLNSNLTPNTNGALISVYDSVGITNKITLPERFNTFTLVISKAGYKTYTKQFSKEDLKLHLRSVDKGPLVVLLDKNQISNPDITTGLVAYYKFNGDVKDYSGNNNNGTYYGRELYAEGYKSDPSGSLDLNGSSDYVLINNSPSLNLTSKITVCAWYYSASFYGNGANTLVCKQNTLSPSASAYHLAVQGDLYNNNPVFIFNVSTDQYYHNITTSSVFNYSMQQWYFVAGVYDGNYIKLYVNGNLISTGQQSGNIVSSNNNVTIGSTEGLTRPQNDYLKGRIDEVRIYNRALTDNEILYLSKQ